MGTYDDIVRRREGQYRLRLMDNTRGADCAYPGLVVLPDGTVDWKPKTKGKRVLPLKKSSNRDVDPR